MMHYGLTLATYNGLTVIACFKCGFAHLDPLPEPQQVVNYYQDSQGFYRGKEAGLKIDASHHRQGLWNTAHNFEANQLHKYARPASHLIDLGCGTGWFIKWWNDQQGHAIGVEPSKVAIALAPQSDRIESSLNLATRRFSSGVPVHLRARLVLEHLPQPVGFLEDSLKIRQTVRGFLIIVPNDFNPLQQQIIKRDKVGHWFIDETHCNYFNQRGLTNCLQMAGLEPVFWGATFPMEIFVLMGFNYIGNDILGQKCHLIRLKIEKVIGPQIFNWYSLLFKWFGWGREIICIAIPKKEKNR